jgi:hypothetical protein
MSAMAPKYCSAYAQQQTKLFFFKNPALGVNSGFYKTYYKCRGHKATAATNAKRKALQELDPNIGPTKKSKASIRRKVIALIPPLVETPPIIQTRPEARPELITRPKLILSILI